MHSILRRHVSISYTSILKVPLGAHFITGGTEEGVLTMTRWHLKDQGWIPLMITHAPLTTES